MELKKGKILSIVWFNQGGIHPKCIGIIRAKNSIGEEHFYIGAAIGLNERQDVEYVLAYGAKVSIEQLINDLQLDKKVKND